MIGGGGFASVWRARSVGLGGFERPVAIKVMRPARAKLKRFQDMLLDEARLVARIEHPNVAQIWEVGEDPRSIYVVMELVDGAPLDVLRDRAEESGRTLPIGAVFRVLADVCGGLHAAHELTRDDGEPLGLVHRDVSPQNILVSRHGTAKLIDFGIAKAKERLGADTRSGFIKGKISFMAPEQARAEEVDRRADVWAVGAVAYDLLAGHPPVEAPSDLARLAILGGPEPIPPLGDEVPAPLRQVVARALAKDREARFPTALAMKQAIEDALVESEHETTVDEAARLLAPFFAATVAARASVPDREDGEVGTTGGATGAGPRDDGRADDPAPGDGEGRAAGSVERGVSSTIDARIVEGSIEIPVNRTRIWPLGLGALLAGGVAWWAFTPSDDPVTSSTPAGSTGGIEPGGARSSPAGSPPGGEVTVAPSGALPTTAGGPSPTAAPGASTTASAALSSGPAPSAAAPSAAPSATSPPTSRSGATTSSRTPAPRPTSTPPRPPRPQPPPPLDDDAIE